MKKKNKKLVFSATDLLGYMACSHHTTLGLLNLETPIEKAVDDGQAELIQQKGDEHETNYLEELEAGDLPITRIAVDQSNEARFEATLEAMRSGAEVIYQAAFKSGPLMGYADFLRRVPIPSNLGNYSYEVLDTKLARSPKAKFAIQLCFYSKLLADVQGVHPERAYIVLGNGDEVPLRLADYRYYFDEVLARFLTHCEEKPDTRPEPCGFCDLCPWRVHCNAQWEEEDHLAFVAGITRGQIDRLRAAGIWTLEALATLAEDVSVNKLASATFEKLRNQARLQFQARSQDAPIVETLPVDPDGVRGFYRLPEPSPGDLYFDMEGDPLEADGLEYLFGVYYFQDDQAEFKAFWGHDRQQERLAFQGFMDFVTEHLHRHPAAHIYHYAPYEVTALKRLMSLHGTREAQVDDLLRRSKLVDLYRVVRESVRISEPSYSIKNLEVFYREAREGDVKDAGASIVAYEQWRATGDQALLDEIEEYNRIDCESTWQLREWLMSLRPPELPFYTCDYEPSDSNEPSKVSVQEEKLAACHKKLVGNEGGTHENKLAELIYQLLDFHRRNDKPVWWAMFARHEMTEEELAEDIEALAGLVEDTEVPREPVKSSVVVTYRFPDQEFKMREGDSPIIAVREEPAGQVYELDPEQQIVRLKRGLRKYGPLPEQLSIIPGGPIKHDVLRDALYRVADSLSAGDKRFGAVKALLQSELPQVDEHESGTPLLPADVISPEAIADVVSRMNESYLFIQGPPGAGKTYTGSYVIVELIRQGYRVGVTSNSHKAINNLLEGVERWAKKRGVKFRGVKKASHQNPDSEFEGNYINSCLGNGDALAALEHGAALIAGTAWLFSWEDLDSQIDYLFVDEAGQVALANLAAMGTSAKNIVLLGDQMQLGQPIQGIHPGRSGESSLEYLLNEHATIPEERGIFLPDTYRMHPAVTRFISDAIYDGRLKSAEGNELQRLTVDESIPEYLKEPGLTVLEVESEGRSQSNAEEAEVIRLHYNSLLGQAFVSRSGEKCELTADNILVVAPYNMQVNLLKQVLGENARVGTVDKFQGQEAEVVFISMATSSQDYMPRFLDFLFSRNRLNVAISRARIKSVLVMSPDLTKIECNSLEQIKLVNTLCWARHYASLET